MHVSIHVRLKRDQESHANILLTADMLDLRKYSGRAKDQHVVAWPYPEEPADPKQSQKNTSFKVKAQLLLETDHGKAWREMWEKLQRDERRAQRKAEKDRRQGKSEKEDGGKDEL